MSIPTKKAAKLQHAGTQFLSPETHPKDSRKTHLDKPSFQQKYEQRLPYIVRHPIDGIWGWLSSVRTAIFLITSIAVICFIGIYFVQAPGEVLTDPVAYAAWIQQNALPRYGSLTPIFDWLRFYTIFSSWYFMLLLTVLSLSIVICTLNRAPGIWHNFKHPLIKRNDNFYQNALERIEFTHPDASQAVQWTQDHFRKRGYRVRLLKDTEVTYLYANKNSWATLSTFVFHAALVTLLMAGVLSQWHGFAPNSLARRILPAPLVGLSDNLAVFTFDQALPNRQSAVVFHQTSLISSVNITISDVQGCLVCDEAIVLDQSESISSNLAVDFAKGIPITGSKLTLGVFFIHRLSVQLPQTQHPSILITVGAPNTPPTQDKAVVRLQQGQSGQSFDKKWSIKLNRASEATVLLVTKDAGSMLVWPTAILLILSLCITFYFPQKRLWIRVKGQQV